MLAKKAVEGQVWKFRTMVDQFFSGAYPFCDKVEHVLLVLDCGNLFPLGAKVLLKLSLDARFCVEGLLLMRTFGDT